MHRVSTHFLSVAALSTTPTLALAGPAYTEPPPDSGSSKATAADATSITGSGTISGTLSGTAIAREGGSNTQGPPPDFEDMYIIRIQQPGRWQVTTSPNVGRGQGFAAFDSVLYLFRFSDERGVLANDDIFMGQQESRFRNVATDGTSFTINTPGMYLLAISVKGRVPISQSGQPIFVFSVPTEVSGADGSTLPLQQWVGPPVTQIPGDYTIEISVPPCPGDVNGDQQVNLSDIAAVTMQWNTTVMPWFGADLSGDGLVGLADIAQIINNWAQPCF